MSDWKAVPAISANTFVVENGPNKVRIVFGETFGTAEEANFHVAVIMGREGVRWLIDTLQKTLSPGGAQGGSTVTIGSTSLH
jgi:hypothetical protein